jgi:hypothetical protein
MKNYLGKTKEVKAPVRWKSSPDAPDTQLAYITQPEIDMLVQANIHGSMNGKPNMGPKGIISLDGMGAEDTRIPEEKIRDRPFSPNVISSGNPQGGFTGSGTSSNQGSGSGTSSVGQTIYNATQPNVVDPGLQQKLNYVKPNNDPIPSGTMVPASSDPFIQRQQAGQSMFDAGIANIGGKPVGGTLAGAGGANEGQFSIGVGTDTGDGSDDDFEMEIDGQDDSDDGKTRKETKDGKTKYFIQGVGEVSGKMYGAYRRLIGQGVPEKDIISAIKGLGAAEEKFSAENLNQLSDMKISDFFTFNLLKSALKTPDYENKFLGSAGAANILNKLNSLTGKTAEETAKLKQDYINRIIKKNPEGFTDLFTKGKGGTGNYKNPSIQEFEDILVGANIGNKNFDKNYYGTQADYYKINPPPATSGGLADLASLDAGSVSDPFLKQQIFNARMELDRMGKNPITGESQQTNTGGGGGGGAGGGGAGEQNDTTTTTLPDYSLVRQYRQDEGFTPNYLGGPEQIQLAGGFYDPTAQEFLFDGAPYGGSTNYIGNPQQYFSQGGMVDGKGLSGFKMKGF